METGKPKEYTDKELDEFKTKMETFFKEQLPFLKLQAEYETTRALISEGQLRMVLADTRLAEMQAKQPPEPKQE